MQIQASIRLRATAQQTEITAARVSQEVRLKFIKQLFKNAKFAKLRGQIDSQGASIEFEANTADESKELYEKIVGTLKNLGFTKPWKDSKAGGQGLACDDGTWPIRLSRASNHVWIEAPTLDTLDRKVNKEDAKSYRTVAKEIHKTLGLSGRVQFQDFPGNTGTSISYNRVKLEPSQAIKLLKAYGKGKITDASTDVKGTEGNQQLTYVMGHGVIKLYFVEYKGFTYLNYIYVGIKRK